MKTATTTLWLIQLLIISVSLSRVWGFGSSSSSNNNNAVNKRTSRADFVSSVVFTTSSLLVPSSCNAFDGGVGGLGKTRPETGVVFRDEEAAASTTQSSSGDVTYELLAPDGSPAFVTFNSPWPLLQTAAGIECRDISGGFESAFVQVAELKKDTNEIKLLQEAIFGSKGKFGMYGSPTDIKIKKVQSSEGLYLASFTTLTPAMRESDRKAYISTSKVGNGMFILVTTSTAVRFAKLDNSLQRVAESFTAIPAPSSSLRNQK
jgi:hypothetical protein